MTPSDDETFVVLPYVFRFLNREYAAAFPVYQVYVIGTFFMYNAALRAGHYTLIGKSKIMLYATSFSVVINIIMNYLWIKWFGLYGAALATVITQAISLMFSNLIFGTVGREVFMWQIMGMNPRWIFVKTRNGD